MKTHQPQELVKQQPVNEVHKWLLWGTGEALCGNRKQSITREKEEIYFTWRITPFAIRKKNSLQDESANNLQIKDSNGS